MTLLRNKTGVGPTVAELERQLASALAERDELLQQQAASAEILRVINTSPGDLAPVFDIILEKAHSLCNAPCGSLQLYEGDHIRAVAVRGMTGAFEKFLRQGFQVTDLFRRNLDPDHVIRNIDLAELLERTPDEPSLRAAVELGGIRTMVAVPLVGDGVVLGRIVAARQEVRPFSNNQIALLQSFAAQAVVAIANARLFNEVQARAVELSESLQQQTATADVLKVISRSAFDLQTVLQTLVESAARLCEADEGIIIQPRDDAYGLVANWGLTPPKKEFLQNRTFRPGDGSITGQAVTERKVVHIHDVGERPYLVLPGDPDPARTRLAVPLLRDGIAVGVFVLTRVQVRPFTDRQIELVQTFADQAVIAIENVRLFNETREALERQTATAEILRVIASSPGDVQPVLDAVADRAMRLLSCSSVLVVQFDGEQMHFGAARGALPGTEEYMRKLFPARLDAEVNYSSRCILERAAINVPDFQEDPNPQNRERARTRGFRAAVIVPMLRDDEPIGTISVSRKEAGAFAANEVELLQTFADQAVIAIENVRLFNETKEALEQQTATADILKVIASSPADVQPVFQAIAERSNRLVNGLSTTVLTIAGETVNLSAFTKTNPAADAALVGSFPRQLSAQPWSQPNLRGEIYRVPDTEAEPSLRDLARLRGYRSMLFVPLLQNGVPIGMIGQTRAEPGSFAENHVQLLKTFADQAVIAISNVRLFQQVQERTRELSQSLDDLRAAQDRLVQTEKLASLGQLTAGIAHEIKNPLNFVNNFSALSAELIDELDEALAPAALDQKTRNNVGELTQMLKSNLEKVVQHGKRADSIVKNMLLHSREGGGEHRVADINAIVDESLNLAYHGARAERSGFNIALRRELDPEAGMVELYPQEITRVLLNLISNGFYAATKRKEAGDGNFEPMLSAKTKGFSDRIEIRIRDNGAGIPLEVKEKMFNPFFTTKPAGEGTGLGLSMSHDIVVKQHGGKIDVDTVLGEFTEFIITLPRNAAARPNTGGTN